MINEESVFFTKELLSRTVRWYTINNSKHLLIINQRMPDKWLPDKHLKEKC